MRSNNTSEGRGNPPFEYIYMTMSFLGSVTLIIIMNEYRKTFIVLLVRSRLPTLKKKNVNSFKFHRIIYAKYSLAKLKLKHLLINNVIIATFIPFS